MSYKVEMNKEVRKFLHSHPEVSAKIISALEQIAQNPFENNLDIKRLQGESHKYRLRIGKYRLLYEIIQSQILIYAYKAQSRGDIYK
ncbi:type II toxin-antitoxin system RelE family toxin [Helicobacter sp. 23-1046]